MDCRNICVFQTYSGRFFLNCLFTQFIVTSLVVVSWSTLWLVQLDILGYLKDENANVVALVIGYWLVVTVLLLNRMLGRIRGKLQGFSWLAALTFENVVTVVAWFYLCFMWRGAWMTAERVVRLESDVESAWLSFAIGECGLQLSGTTAWVGGLGCDIDGQPSNSKVMFDCAFLKRWKQVKPKPGHNRPKTENVAHTVCP